MKTKFFAVLTLVMVLAMSTTAFAAGSSDANSVAAEASTPVEAARTAVQGISSGNAVIVPAAVSQAELTTITETAKSLGANAQVLSCADYCVVSGEFGGQLSVACAGISAGDNIVIIHHGKKGIEVVKPDSVSNGSVTFTLKDLSPIAIIKLPPGATVSYTRSPKTGEVIALMVIAMISFAGAFACAKKIKSN